MFVFVTMLKMIKKIMIQFLTLHQVIISSFVFLEADSSQQTVRPEMIASLSHRKSRYRNNIEISQKSDE